MFEQIDYLYKMVSQSTVQNGEFPSGTRQNMAVLAPALKLRSIYTSWKDMVKLNKYTIEIERVHKKTANWIFIHMMKTIN